VINIESTLKSVAQAFEAAEMMSGRRLMSVYTGIAGHPTWRGSIRAGVVAVTGREGEITTR
jgi:cell division ATPase FtsA